MSCLAANFFDPEILNIASDLEKYIIPSLNKRAKKHACHLQNPVHEVGLEELRVFVYTDTEEELEAKAYDIRKAVMKGVAESKYLLRYSNHGMTSPCFVGVTFYNPKLQVLGGFWNGNYYAKPPGDRWTGRWVKKTNTRAI